MTNKNIQFITFLSITLLMAYFGLTGTAYAITRPAFMTNPERLEWAKNNRECGEYQVEHISELLDANMLHRLCLIESRLTDVERQVGQLILKIDGLETQVKNPSTSVSVDNSRIEAVEQRVSILERAVSSFQNNVLVGLNRVISILEKLLKR